MLASSRGHFIWGALFGAVGRGKVHPNEGIEMATSLPPLCTFREATGSCVRAETVCWDKDELTRKPISPCPGPSRATSLSWISPMLALKVPGPHTLQSQASWGTPAWCLPSHGHSSLMPGQGWAGTSPFNRKKTRLPEVL